MKYFHTFFLVLALSLTTTLVVHAQAGESIWIQSNASAYKTQETVTVTINGLSATPVQGFTAQIRYDPACLQPLNSTSPMAGMNGLAVPQQAGLADVSFASTTPQAANGMLAEVHFTALKGCQTQLHIETASLVIRNESGFAAPVAGIHVDQNPLSLNIDSAVGESQAQVSNPAALPLTPKDFPASPSINWRLIGLMSATVMLVGAIVGLFAVLRPAQQR